MFMNDLSLRSSVTTFTDISASYRLLCHENVDTTENKGQIQWHLMLSAVQSVGKFVGDESCKYLSVFRI